VSTPEVTPQSITIDVEHFDSPDAQRLRAAQRIEIDSTYGGDTEPGRKPTAESMAVFFVARDQDGTPLGCGGRRLEEAALDLGSPAVVLETGPAQTRAIRFYEREGFTRIANFGPYQGAPLSICFSKLL
jgi:ribosomal protein S18 acetylase RimI-like enzyme